MSHNVRKFNGNEIIRRMFPTVVLSNEIAIHISIAHRKFSTQTQGTIYDATLIINHVRRSLTIIFIIIVLIIVKLFFKVNF